MKAGAARSLPRSPSALSLCGRRRATGAPRSHSVVQLRDRRGGRIRLLAAHLQDLGLELRAVLASCDGQRSLQGRMIHSRASWKTKEAVEFATLDGCLGSTTIACSNPSAISGVQKLRQTITGHSPIIPPRRRHDLNQPAAMKAGAIH